MLNARRWAKSSLSIGAIETQWEQMHGAVVLASGEVSMNEKAEKAACIHRHVWWVVFGVGVVQHDIR